MSRGRRSGRPRASADDETGADRPAAASSRARSDEKRLTDEDRALWAKVTGSVNRADSAPAPEPASAPKLPAPPPPKQGAPASQAVKPVAPLTKSPPISVRRAAPEVDRLSGSTPGLDRRTAERLRRGKVAPDARLDLHGLTADRAHRALISFIQRSHASGARCVLVITGKGGRPRDPEPGVWREPEPGAGVLKTNTPIWLRQAPLAGLVVGVYPAHISHGGGGALYVYLRKSGR